MKMYQEIVVVVLCFCFERRNSLPLKQKEYETKFSHLPSLNEHNYGKTIPGIILTEGDIIKDQETRQAVNNDVKTWHTNTVPYTLDNKYNDREKAFIQGTLNNMAKLIDKCIKFKLLSSVTKRAQEVIRIEKKDGCFSSVGRQGFAQTLSLGEMCYRNGSEWYKGTIMHEVMHALGFWHEHTRPDRDTYITLYDENIIERYKDDYKKMSESKVKILVEDYDLYSVMHYSPYTFAKDPSKRTFNPTETADIERIGQRSSLSESDVKRIKKLYNCDSVKKIQCPTPRSKKMTCTPVSVKFETGSSVSCSCSDGYILVGSSIRYCTNTRRWTGDNPVCLENTVSHVTDFCDFGTRRNPFCGWHTQTDFSRWERRADGTHTANTGPSFDHTRETSAGYYMYIESSVPAYEGQVFRMRKTVTIQYNTSCMTFYYNAYGSGITNNGLRVFVVKSPGNLNKDAEIQVWPTTTSKFIAGDQNWKRAEIRRQPLPGKNLIDIIIEAERGTNFESDIAVDDILVATCDDVKLKYPNLVRD